MINIIDQYTQVSFEKINDDYKYSGTCDIKNNSITRVNVTVYNKEYNYRLCDMTSSKNSGVSISLVDNANLDKLASFVTMLKDIRLELEDYLLNNKN